jgi:hypothetical protein
MPDSQAASMDGPKDSEAAEPVTMQQFRERYRRSRENHRRYIAEHGIEAMEKILEVVIIPPSVNVTENRGNDPKLEMATEMFYANGRR